MIISTCQNPINLLDSHWMRSCSMLYKRSNHFPPIIKRTPHSHIPIFFPPNSTRYSISFFLLQKATQLHKNGGFSKTHLQIHHHHPKIQQPNFKAASTVSIKIFNHHDQGICCHHRHRCLPERRRGEEEERRDKGVAADAAVLHDGFR